MEQRDNECMTYLKQPFSAQLARVALASLLLCTGAASQALTNPDTPNFLASFTQQARTFEDRVGAQSSTAEVVSASADYRKFLDQELNDAYQKLIKQLPAASVERLRASQREWVKHFRNEKIFIDAQWSRENVGTSAALSQAMFTNALVKARIEQLLAYRMEFPAK